uniref:Uncharacterized protein n=1 Tax=Caenorhabditis tropicalis TaxID=1561998 RepID=A0A1I7SYY9_9PELO
MANRKKNNWSRKKKQNTVAKVYTFDRLDRDRTSPEYIQAMIATVPEMSEVREICLDEDTDVPVFGIMIEDENREPAREEEIFVKEEPVCDEGNLQNKGPVHEKEDLQNKDPVREEETLEKGESVCEEEDPQIEEVISVEDQIRRSTRIIRHDDIDQFMNTCPHLDKSRAFAFLSAMTLEESIKKGKGDVMTTKGCVPKWILDEVEDPRDEKLPKKKKTKKRPACHLKMNRVRDQTMIPIKWKKTRAQEQSQAKQPEKIDKKTIGRKQPNKSSKPSAVPRVKNPKKTLSKPSKIEGTKKVGKTKTAPKKVSTRNVLKEIKCQTNKKSMISK